MKSNRFNISVLIGKLIEDEETGDRVLTMGTIYSYIQSAGGIFAAIILYMFFAVSVGMTVFSSWWLSIWLNDGSGVRP